MKWYLKNLLIGIDQVFNCIFMGWSDETFSSRCYREFPKLVPFLDTIFFFDPNHCEESYRSERERRQFPVELR